MLKSFLRVFTHRRAAVQSHRYVALRRTGFPRVNQECIRSAMLLFCFLIYLSGKADLWLRLDSLPREKMNAFSDVRVLACGKNSVGLFVVSLSAKRISLLIRSDAPSLHRDKTFSECLTSHDLDSTRDKNKTLDACQLLLLTAYYTIKQGTYGCSTQESESHQKNFTANYLHTQGTHTIFFGVGSYYFGVVIWCIIRFTV